MTNKKDTLLKACNRETTDYVPNVLTAGGGVLSYADTDYYQIDSSYDKLEAAFDKVMGNTWFDTVMIAINGSPRSHKALGGRTETFVADDGVSTMHVQLDKMKEDEYPQLIENMEKFVKEVLLPRKYPILFNGDKEQAKNILKTVVEENIHCYATGPMAGFEEKLYKKYGTPETYSSSLFVSYPLDVIFDFFRGFKGTITDLRRHHNEVKDACDMLYATYCNHFDTLDFEFPFAPSLPHIPTYLSLKQFDELFWPYMQEMYNNISKARNKVFLSLEGRWMPLIEYFNDLPKDSCVIIVDDDDIFEVNKKIGANQILGGGIKIQNIRLNSLQNNIDYAKKVIDECASGGGFLFASDKWWSCKGDVNDTLLKVFNFAHEYTSK